MAITHAMEGIELDGEARLWDLMRAALQAKEAQPRASLLPAILILKSNEIVAKVYQSAEEPRALLVRTCTGIRKISFNWYDALLMLYRTTVLTLQKTEGTSVIFFGERSDKNTGRAMICAMSGRHISSCNRFLPVHSFPKRKTPYRSFSTLTTRRSAGYQR